MKRMMIILFAIGMTAMSSTSLAAMSTSRVRQETRFLTDKMAYELGLNSAQYNDAYEINYDFIYSIRNTMDNVVRGQEWALNEYYYYLDIRNDDLRWVLDSQQYRRFMQIDYFYRPIYASTNGWAFRVYITYSNRGLFYFGVPIHYTTYRGAHFRVRNNNVSFYRERYHHPIYRESHSVRDDRVYHSNRRSDFGRISIRPNSDRRPDGRDKTYSSRPSNGTPYRDSNTRPSSPSNDRGNRDNRRENNAGTIRRSSQDVKRDVDDRNNVRSVPSNNSRSNATPFSSGSRRSATETRSSSSGESRNSEQSSSRRSGSKSTNVRSSEGSRRSASKPTSNERSQREKSPEGERSSSRTPSRR